MAAPTKLAVATSRRAGIPNSLRTGTVVSVSAAGVVVDVAGGLVPCSLVGGAGAGVAPGAIVSVFKQGSSWQVQGVLNGPGQNADTPNQPLPSTNSVILPPVITTVPGSIRASADANIVTGLNSTFGTYLTTENIWVTLPKGHLCQVLLSAYQSVATVANFLTVITVRDNNLATGPLLATFEQFNPLANNGSHFTATGWLIGDGAQHNMALCAACATTSGTVNIVRSANSFFGVIDWGDASGVTVR